MFKYSPQHDVLKHPQLPYLPQYQRPSLKPLQINTLNISTIYMNIKFLNSNLQEKSFCTEWQQAIPELNLLLISYVIEFWFVKVIPKYLNSI